MFDEKRIKAGYRGRLIRETFEIDLHYLASRVHIPVVTLQKYENQEDYPPLWAGMSIASFFNVSLSFLYGFDNCEAFYQMPGTTEVVRDKDRLPEIISKIHSQKSVDPKLRDLMKELEVDDKLLEKYSKPYNILDNPFDILDLYKLSLLTNCSVDYLLGIIQFQTSYDFISYVVNNEKKYSMHQPPTKYTFLEYYLNKSLRTDDTLKYRLMTEIHNNGYNKFSFIEFFNENSEFNMPDTALYNLLYRKNGLLPIRYVIKIAELFNCSLDYLYCYSDRNIPNECFLYNPRFEELRIAGNLSITKFKKILGSTHSYDSFAHEQPIETIQIRINTIQSIVDNFACSLDWLFGFKSVNENIGTKQTIFIKPANLKKGSIVTLTSINTNKREFCICIGKDPASPYYILRSSSDKRIVVDATLVSHFKVEILNLS